MILRQQRAARAMASLLDRPPGFLEALAHRFRLAWGAIALAVVTLGVFRWALLRTYRPAAWTAPAGDLVSGFLMGARFDLKIAAIAFGAVTALALPTAALGERSPRWLSRLPGLALVLVFLALDLTALVNHFYYGFYHRPIDALLFGLVEDDTVAVLLTVWRDYPVLRALLGLAALVVAQSWLALRPRAADEARPGRSLTVALLAAAGLVLAGRGSLGLFPLHEADLAVSADRFVNDLVPCGAESIFLAVRERRANRLDRDPLAGLKRAGFASPLEAAGALGLEAHTEAELLERLYPTMPPAPAATARPPHVVVALMESWGDDLLSFHRPGNDLLGRLAPHLEHGLLFRRAASISYGTDGTLEALLLSTPIIPLLSSAYADRLYDTSVALPYRASGYRTVFMTSSSGGWRNINRSLPRQGFDEVVDMADLQRAFPGAGANSWGVWDEFLFRQAARRLREADRKGEKLFLFLLTTTNHPPHAIPADYHLRPIDLGAFAGERLASDPVLSRATLETYQYACDGLGGLLDEIESSPLADHTLLAATGDHNLRTFFDYAGDDRIPRRFGVPILLHAPSAYLAGRTPDTARWAGHRDLFPTLASLALPGARIFASGRDLTAPARRPTRALVDFTTVIGDEGVVPNLLHPTLLGWRDGALVPCPDAACREPLERAVREERAYGALLDWNIRRQALAPRR